MLIPNFIFKIKNKTLRNSLTLTLAIIQLFFLIGFFVFPFLNYKSTEVRNCFSILWVFSAVFFIYMSIKTSKDGIDPQRKISIGFQKIIYISFYLVIISGFGLSLLSKQFHIGGNIADAWKITGLLFVLILAVFMTYALYNSSSQKEKERFRFMLLSGMLGSLFFLGLLLDKSHIGIASYFKIISGGLLACTTISYIFKTFGQTEIEQISISKYIWFTISYLGVVALGIYLINNINDENLRGNIFIVFGAIMGGALTLLGVAWTINYQNQRRIEEEKNKVKPQIIYLHNIEDNSEIKCIKIEPKKFLNISKEGNFFKLWEFRFYVTDNADGVIKKVIVNKNIINFQYQYLLNKDKLYEICLDFYFVSNGNNEILLVIEDLQGYEYIYKIEYTIEEDSPDSKFSKLIPTNIRYMEKYDKSQFKEAPNET